MKSKRYPSAIWLIVPFNIFSAFLCVLTLWPVHHSSAVKPGEYDFYYDLVSTLTRVLSTFNVALLTAATFLLLRRPLENRRRAAVCQRFAFWGLFLIVAVNFLGASLPSEGDFLLGIFLVFFSILTLAAFWCARQVTGWSRWEAREEAHDFSHGLGNAAR